MGRAIQLNVSARVQEVARLIIAGASADEVLHYAQQRQWNVGPRQLRRYIAQAHAQFAADACQDRQQLLGRHLLQRRMLYARALQAKDLRTALLVLRDEAALQGLYPEASVVQQTNVVQVATSLPVEDRRQRLLQIVRAIAQRNALSAPTPDPASCELTRVSHQ